MKKAGIIIFIITITVYLAISIKAEIEWNQASERWRQQQINNSPTVCITQTGERYHRCYHYSGRNFQLSLFEAVEQGYTPCGTCNPISIPAYSGKPQPLPFLLTNWIVISIIYSVFYWLLVYLFLKKCLNQKNK